MNGSNIAPQNLPLDPTPRTSQSAPEILLPTSTPPAAPSSRTGSLRPVVALGDPGEEDAIATPVPEKKALAKQPPPPPMMDDDGAPTLPVGIANYAQVKDNVSTGLRPNLLEGLDWLKKNNFRTILYLRSEKENDSSDQLQVTNRSMIYKSMIISPEKIGPSLVAEFNQVINESDGKSLFVYDRDGALAGAMWYLYFVTYDQVPEAEAQAKARRYGLKAGTEPESVALWTAVQKYLSDRKSKD